MQKTIYLYVLDTMADWEISYILQSISMQQLISKNTPHYTLKTVALTKSPIKTLGGLNITPDCSLEELDEDDLVALLLPGANIWSDEAQKPILEKATSYIEKGILVAAICGATLASANLGMLNNYFHTSNSLEYLNHFSEHYKGHALYQDKLSVRDRNLITASSAGGLLWAKQILEHLNVYSNVTIDAWYQYYLTGDLKYYMALLSSME